MGVFVVNISAVVVFVVFAIDGVVVVAVGLLYVDIFTVLEVVTNPAEYSTKKI